MNRRLPRLGAGIVTGTVFLFAICLLADFSFGSYVVCMLLPLGYIMMAAGLAHESAPEKRVAANIGMVFSAIYAVLILLVYFAQTTTVQLGGLSAEAAMLLDFKKGGLIFNYDLLGYGMMALSTFFIGLSITAGSKPDKWLKGLMTAHGVFFIGCFILPMTGAFVNMTGNGGVIALLCWCAYFIPIGILSFLHFGTTEKPK